MTHCTASTGEGHAATMQVNGLWWCDEHGARTIAINTPPKNLERLVRKVRRRTHKRRVKLLAKMSEQERVWVAKRLAGYQKQRSMK